MKRVFIVHGWGGNPNEPMLVWLKENLEAKGYIVTVPEMPNTDEPVIDVWVNYLKNISEFDEETYFIGHSIGCQTILRTLMTMPPYTKVGKIVLIAPWVHLKEETYEDEDDKKIAKPWIETPMDWRWIKNMTSGFVAIFSDNDPFVPLEDKEIFKEKLNAKIIVEHDKGHFDPDSNVKELPVVLEQFE